MVVGAPFPPLEALLPKEGMVPGLVGTARPSQIPDTRK